VAKQATALQNLAAGRFVLGLGVGSHAEEYARAGVDFHRRGRLMDEGIAAMRRAWSTEETTGTRYRQDPSSTRVPLWIGGSSAAARRRAAAVGDGWVPLFLSADDYGHALDELRRETREAGRLPDEVEPAVVVFAHVGAPGEAHSQGARWLSDFYGVPPGAFDRHLVAGPPEACAEALSRYAEAGARHIVVMIAGDGALQHFGLLRSAFLDRAVAMPARLVDAQAPLSVAL
jgi:alkanesulfonate monooxygenase SsuD/methylene tetrahydromethanopterin reductase-like flavin-dependent oxidoreductase (luciferase family)